MCCRPDEHTRHGAVHTTAAYLAHTRADPWAVVVKLVDARVAVLAVLGARRAVDLARPTVLPRQPRLGVGGWLWQVVCGDHKDGSTSIK